MPFSRSLTALLAAGCLTLAAPCARAADEAGPEDPRAKLKAQVEKILKLMRENETALLEASMAGGATPKGPDIKVPDVPPAPGAPGAPETPPPGTPPPSGSSGSEGTPSGNGSAGARGEEIRKKLDEIIKGQQSGSSRIPEELAELVRMIPVSGGSGSPQQGPEQQPQDGDKNETPEARDARKRKELEEQQGKQPQGGKDPKNPQDQRDPKDGGGRPPGESDPAQTNPRDPKERPWLATLPPENRDSDSGSSLERLPGRLGQIIQDYLRSLHTQGNPGATSR